MNGKAVFDFLNDVIFENAIKNNLDAEVVKKSITDYKNYLKVNNFADEETLNFITRIEEKTEVYLRLAKDLNDCGMKLSVYSIVNVLDKCVKEREELRNSNTVCGVPTRDERRLGINVTDYLGSCEDSRETRRGRC